MKDKYLYLVIAVLAAILYFQTCKKSKEGFYDGRMYIPDLDPKMMSRTTFDASMRNGYVNDRIDPYISSGVVKNDSDNIYLATYNDSIEPLPQQVIREGFSSDIMREAPGAVDAASYINKDFANMVADVEAPVSKESSKPNTLEYNTPKELLPVPDMRQTLMRDPSDPTNFMYDRTLFAPLKKRNLNEADRFRGDLDIPVMKTGWFDIATIPHVDLVKGYFGYYNDIEQYQDIQDMVQESRRDTGEGKLQANKMLNSIITSDNEDKLKPSNIWTTQPPLKLMKNSPFDPSLSLGV